MKKRWWALYPFVGLEITNPGSGFGNPLLEDYHILSASSVTRLPSHLRYQAIKSQKNGKSDLMLRDDIKRWFEPIGKDCDSLIAVRKRIGDDEKILEKALDDANLFAAIVSVACYTEDVHPFYCALKENIIVPGRRLGAAFTIEGKSITIGHHSTIESSPDVYIRPKAWKKSRQQLKKLLLSKTIGFGRILLTPSVSTQSFRSPLQAAILTFDKAIRERDRSSELLGYVSAIDMLFSDDDHSTFKKLKPRLTVVLNEPTTEWLQIKEVFDARHNFVHAGKRIADRGLVGRARHTALISIIMYSNLASLFKNRNAMLTYLDAIALVKRVTAKPQGEIASDIPSKVKRIRNEFAKLKAIGYTQHFVYEDSLADYMMDFEGDSTLRTPEA